MRQGTTPGFCWYQWRPCEMSETRCGCSGVAPKQPHILACPCRSMPHKPVSLHAMPRQQAERSYHWARHQSRSSPLVHVCLACSACCSKTPPCFFGARASLFLWFWLASLVGLSRPCSAGTAFLTAPVHVQQEQPFQPHQCMPLQKPRKAEPLHTLNFFAARLVHTHKWVR